MALNETDKQRIEAEVERMVREYRARPTQEKEDALGVELLRMPPEERDYTTTVLLRIVASERG